MGAVVRLDRGSPIIATRSGVLLRAEHAVDFAKGKPGKRGKRSKRAADAEIASSAGVDGMLPSVGDVVAEVCVTSGHDMGVILRVLPRRTSFERWRGKNRGERQVLAANVDVIFIVQPLGAERDTLPLMRDRVARSLVLARDCGADPVVVLTKVDRCEPAEVADVWRPASPGGYGCARYRDVLAHRRGPGRGPLLHPAGERGHDFGRVRCG